MDTSDRPERGHPILWFPAIVMLFQAISCRGALTGEMRFCNLPTIDDIESYVALADSLADDRGYTKSQDPTNYVPHKHFPPGFPMLIAGCLKAWRAVWPGESEHFSLLGPQLLVVAFSLANTALVWVLAREFVSSAMTAFILAMCVLSPLYDRLATHVMAEQVTTFFALAALISFVRWARGGYRLDVWAVTAVATFGYGTLVKGLLLPVLAACWAATWLDSGSARPRTSRVLRGTALAALGVVPWIVWTIRGFFVEAPGYDGLTDIQTHLRGEVLGGPILSPFAFLGFAWQNVKWYFASRLLDSFGGLGWVLEEGCGVALSALARAAILVVFTGGALLSWRHIHGVAKAVPLAVALSFVLLLTRPYGLSPRYWVSLHPLILLTVLPWLDQRLLRTASCSFGRWSCAACGVTAVVVFAAMLWCDKFHRVAEAPAWSAFQRVCRLAEQCTPPEAILISHNEIAACWISHRRSPPTNKDLGSIVFGHGVPKPCFAIIPQPKAIREHGRQTVAYLDGESITLAPGAANMELICADDYYGLYRVHAGPFTPWIPGSLCPTSP